MVTTYTIRRIEFKKNPRLEYWMGQGPHWQYGVHFSVEKNHWFWGCCDGPSPCDSLEHGIEMCHRHLLSDRNLGRMIDPVIIRRPPKLSEERFLKYARDFRNRIAANPPSPKKLNMAVSSIFS